MALTDNLVAFWELEEASGTREDAHSTNDLADNNTVTSATGKVGTAADFEASNAESLSIAGNAALQAGDIDFTIAAWVNLESKDANSGIVVKDSPTDGEYYIRYVLSSDRLNFIVYGTSAFGSLNEVGADTLGSPSVSTWYFVVAWHDATANTINIQVNNGTVDSHAHSAGIHSGTGSFKLGANSFAQYHDGLVDQVGIWKRVLTSQERTDLYNSGNGLSYAALSAGGGATPSPGAGALTLTGAAASLGFTILMPDEA